MSDQLEKREDLLRLRLALERLPVKHRRALIAHFVEGLPVHEVARREQVPVGTVLSRTFTAKQLLRHAWEMPIPAQQARTESAKAQLSEPKKKSESQAMQRGELEQVRSAESPTWDR